VSGIAASRATFQMLMSGTVSVISAVGPNVLRIRNRGERVGHFLVSTNAAFHCKLTRVTWCPLAKNVSHAKSTSGTTSSILTPAVPCSCPTSVVGSPCCRRARVVAGSIEKLAWRAPPIARSIDELEVSKQHGSREHEGYLRIWLDREPDRFQDKRPENGKGSAIQ